jgi:magnesium chelatase family protein
MLARVRTAALWGLDAFPVDCEVDVGPGLPGFVMVGLPDATAREARERVWPALRNAGFTPPDRRVTVNLAPADRRKEGASADLALALGLVVATEQAPLTRFEHGAALGEVALDGTLRGTRGTLSLAESLWRAGSRVLVCPAEPRRSSARRGPRGVRRAHPGEGCGVAARRRTVARGPHLTRMPREWTTSPMRRRGAVARRAPEIAAAGHHCCWLAAGLQEHAREAAAVAAPPLGTPRHSS